MSDLDFDQDPEVNRIVAACVREARGGGNEAEFLKALSSSLADLSTSYAVGILIAKSQYTGLSRDCDKTSLLAQNFEVASDHVSKILRAITIISSSDLPMGGLPALLEKRRIELASFIEKLKLDTDGQLNIFTSYLFSNAQHFTTAKRRVTERFLKLSGHLKDVQEAIKSTSRKHVPRSVRTIEEDLQTSDTDEGPGSLIIVRNGGTHVDHERLKGLEQLRSSPPPGDGRLDVQPKRGVSKIRVLRPGSLLSEEASPDPESSASETEATDAGEGKPAKVAWNVDKREDRNNPSSKSRDREGNAPTACELLFDCLRLNCGCPLPCGSTTPAA